MPAREPVHEAAPGAATGLRLYLDSADPGTWESWLPTGIFYGVTTNPVLLERADQPCTLANLGRLTLRACELEAAEIHLQAWGGTAADLAVCGRELRALDPRTVIKLPLTRAGLLAARTLRREEVPITLTALFDARQVGLAAASGAAYAAPYLGRMTDAGRDGFAEVTAMHEILRRTGSVTRLLVASLRSADQVVELARGGLNTFTIGPPVAAELLEDELSRRAAAEFEQAAERAGRGTTASGTDRSDQRSR